MLVRKLGKLGSDRHCLGLERRSIKASFLCSSTWISRLRQSPHYFPCDGASDNVQLLLILKVSSSPRCFPQLWFGINQLYLNTFLSFSNVIDSPLLELKLKKKTYSILRSASIFQIAHTFTSTILWIRWVHDPDISCNDSAANKKWGDS